MADRARAQFAAPEAVARWRRSATAARPDRRAAVKRRTRSSPHPRSRSALLLCGRQSDLSNCQLLPFFKPSEIEAVDVDRRLPRDSLFAKVAQHQRAVTFFRIAKPSAT